jgi:hypothetical protein
MGYHPAQRKQESETQSGDRRDRHDSSQTPTAQASHYGTQNEAEEYGESKRNENFLGPIEQGYKQDNGCQRFD